LRPYNNYSLFLGTIAITKVKVITIVLKFKQKVRDKLVRAFAS